MSEFKPWEKAAIQVVVNSDNMDEKTLKTLEFPKVIEKLAEFAAFSASAELARAPAASSDP